MNKVKGSFLRKLQDVYVFEYDRSQNLVFFSFKGLKEDKELKNIFYKIRLDGEESDVLLFFINRSDNVIFLDVMLKIFC